MAKHPVPAQLVVSSDAVRPLSGNSFQQPSQAAVPICSLHRESFIEQLSVVLVFMVALLCAAP